MVSLGVLMGAGAGACCVMLCCAVLCCVAVSSSLKTGTGLRVTKRRVLDVDGPGNGPSDGCSQ